MKELRYVLQAAKGDDNHRFIAVLGATKDAIGERHDWEELISIAKGLLDDDCPVVEKLKQISQDKYAVALATTEKLRNEFVHGRSSNRSRAKRNDAVSVSPSALQAVAAIAS